MERLHPLSLLDGLAQAKELGALKSAPRHEKLPLPLPREGLLALREILLQLTFSW